MYLHKYISKNQRFNEKFWKELGEVVKLNFKQFVCFIFCENMLTLIKMIKIADVLFSINAAALTEGTCHLFAVCKNDDCWSCNRNRKLIFVWEDEDGRKIYINIQPNSNVYLMIMEHKNAR